IEYTHADIILQVLGIPIVGVTSIDYRDMQEITPNHGTGHLPISVGIGAVTFEGTLTLTMKEVQRLTDSSPGGRIQN
ncbi:hypothetical protein OE165_28855, partial [Escherichia coli]|uniref:hypothetical protein n=1 Tax=Escherichia coli TaxID=562 RepID=UPI0021F26FB5